MFYAYIINTMGNSYSLEETNLIYENLILLLGINILIKQGKYELNEENKNNIITLYKTFYNPRHSLTKLEEIHSQHRHLKKILKDIVKSYNKYNSLNINVNEYVIDTYNSIKPTLYLLGV